MNVSGEATKSFWMKDTEFPSAPRLEQNERCDVAVVGAGIAGVSIAYELTLAGRKVVLVDRGPLLGGMTSRTTAHLAPICDDGLSELVKVRGGFRRARRRPSTVSGNTFKTWASTAISGDWTAFSFRRHG